MAPRPASWSASRKFGIVIDAGSSGSRVQVYSWLDPEIERQLKKANHENLNVLNRVEKGVQVGDGWHLKVEPGISTFGNNPSALPDYLSPLLSFAASLIPPSQQSTTPIYVLATAGMRLLSPSEQSAIVQETCSILRKSTKFALKDRCEGENVKVITGEEEGLFGWIAVNYLMDGFDNHSASTSVGAPGGGDGSTYGFLDMGGASTQIAFEPSLEERVKHADNLFKVKLGLLSGKLVSHPVFVTTWLGFGTNKARERYIEQEINSYESKHPVPTSPISLHDPCLPLNLHLSSPTTPLYPLRGTGDFASCVARTGPLLNKSVECLDDPCLFNGVHVPAIDFEVNHFIGISEYWYSTMEVWGTDAGGGIYDFVEFEKNAIKYCSRDWDDIMKELKEGGTDSNWREEGVEISRLELQCFKAAWIINILHEGIGIPRIIDDELGGKGDGEAIGKIGVEKAVQKGLLEGEGKRKQPNFQSINQVGDVVVSWTLGKMVLEVSGGSTNEAPGLEPPSLRPTSADSIPYTTRLPIIHHEGDSESTVGHTPAWSGDLRSSLSNFANKYDDFLPFLFLVPFLFAFLYFFFLRKRSTTAPKRPRRNEFGLVSQSDLDEDDNGPNSGGDADSPSRSRPPKNAITKVLSPLRWTTLRAITALRSWSRQHFTSSSSIPLLPTTLSSTATTTTNFRPPLPSSTSSSSSDLYRPRPLRSATTIPFLRNVSGLSTASSSSSASLLPPTTSTTTHWNDAPDVSDRRAISTAAGTAIAPLNLAVASSCSVSRPSTPLSASFTSIRSRDSSLANDEPVGLGSSSSNSGTGGMLLRRMTSETTTSVGSGTVTPPNEWEATTKSAGGSPAGTLGGGGRAKLRTAKSREGSTANLFGLAMSSGPGTGRSTGTGD